MDPINYSGTFANVPSPTQAFGQGAQLGSNIQQLIVQREMQQYQFGRMQAMQQAAGQVAQNPTPNSIAQLSIAFPEISENVKRSYDMLQPTQQRAQLDFMNQVHAAMLSGRPDVASQILSSRADALQNSGAPDNQVQPLRTFSQWATQDPNSFTTFTGHALAGIVGPDKYGETMNNLANANLTEGKTPAEVTSAQAAAVSAAGAAPYAGPKAAADISNLQAQTKNIANKMQLDRDSLMSDTQVKLQGLQLQYGMPPDDARKMINDAAVGAAAGEQSAARLDDLAGRIENAATGWGIGGNINDVYSRATGTENGTQAIKQEVARYINNSAISQIRQQLGTGAQFTDSDMKVALGAVPDVNSNPQLIASYFRGMAKLQRIAAAQQDAQAEWLSQVGRFGNLGPAPRDITVMGTTVPKGTSFTAFAREFIPMKAQQIGAQAAVQAAQGRSYMRFANPQGAPPAAAPGAAPPAATPGAAPPSNGATGGW